MNMSVEEVHAIEAEPDIRVRRIERGIRRRQNIARLQVLGAVRTTLNALRLEQRDGTMVQESCIAWSNAK